MAGTRLATMILAGLLVFSVVPSTDAATLWYNGDWNTSRGGGLRNHDNGGLVSGCCVGQFNVYDDFIVPAGQSWTIDTIWSNNTTSPTNPPSGVSQATWSIRSGVSSGDGGTVIASGLDTATVTPTGQSTSSFVEYTVAVTGLSITLGPGTYWLNVTPYEANVLLSMFNTITTGAGAVGSPPGDNSNAFLYAVTASGTTNFKPTTEISSTATDFSMGVAGVAAAIPLPAPLGLLAVGLGALAVASRRSGRSA